MPPIGGVVVDAGADTLDGGPSNDVATDSTAIADTGVDALTKPDVALVDAADVAAPDVADAGPVDAGVPGLPVGHTCTDASECDSGLCQAVAEKLKICTKACEGDCPAGMRCSLNPLTGSGSIYYCMPLPGSLCQPCKSDAECLGGLCQTIDSSGESLCGLFCDAEAGGEKVCPAGFVCQSFVKGELCVPSLGTCSCDAQTEGAWWACGIATPMGECAGVQTCTSGSWNQCTAALPTPEKCDGQDNNCNGQIDEGLTLTIGGVKVPLGGPCGQGVCAGGTVVCADGKAACSTDVLSIPKELCGDGLDNDCNGKKDDGCPPKDTDGDGTPDLNDCAPYLAEVHPGAKEPCCLALAASETNAKVDVDGKTLACDRNCDGKVTACLKSDKDGDGFAAPGDCDDTDPNAYPGGKEKCGDGIDQDCDGSDLSCAGVQDADKDGYPVGIDCNDGADWIHPGAEEACNFIDDDCDGVTDNGNPGGYCTKAGNKTFKDCVLNLGTWHKAGDKCGVDKGACKQGTLVCTHIGLLAQVTCTDALEPQPELCNGQDDNCDGKTDEDFTDLGKQCDGDDADECANGKYVCGADGVAVVCGIETKFDLLELCSSADPAVGNGADEDCDGQVDEICYGEDVDGDGSPVGTDCNDADASVHPNAKETGCCNPALKGSPLALELCDKNCDGQVTWCAPGDKDFDGKTGADDCDETNPQIFVGAPEKCDDGIDQDCDTLDLSCAKITDNDGDGYAPGPGGDCDDIIPTVHPFAPELCNRKDDNCDGVTDEGNPETKVGPCGSSDGLCKPGKEVCVQQKFKAVVLCVPEIGPVAELCDGQDNNCNGKVDEYFPEVGQPCDGPDKDLCKNGTWQCAADGKGVACDNETITEQVELCDGIDNDCDGETDEGMSYFGAALGASCTGQGACGQGTVVCSPELLVAVCSTDAWGTEPKSEPELCDGVDNDCDGLTDEGMNFEGKKIGEACTGNGACGKSQGVVQCAANKTSAICSTMLGGKDYKGTKEICDGIDNDCDGHVDEDMTVLDSDCLLAGLCNKDNVKATCTAAKWQCNYDGVVGYQPDKEILCDGVDNDCDGGTDEDFNVGLACDGTDTDLCKNGVVVCSEDMLFSLCGTESKIDIVESCNGADDDCDGETDDGFDVGQACDGADSDLCKNGTWTCAKDGKDHECVNELAENLPEVCDSADNDCDGQTDEDFTDLGQDCDGPDADKCANGKRVCAKTQDKTVCGPETVENIEEICDSVDNDCDGSTDEGQVYEGAAMGKDCQGINNCGAGKVVCSPGKKIATCSTNPDAYLIFEGVELCDGLDNDCNGKTDDALTWKGLDKGAVCEPPGVCGKGVVECGKDMQVTCSTLANGSNPQGKPETCDGQDNDCDGQTDEELGVEQSNCKVKGLCTKDNVKASCKSGNWQCDYSGVPGYQDSEATCDGIDNDCDGETDEGFLVGEPCDGDDADQCKHGTWQCSQDGTKGVCVNEKMTDIPEVCDGVDNDCDGKTDEDFTYGGLALGATCDGVGECGAGKVVCSKSSQMAVCTTDPDGPNPQSKPEICNAKDDDCDGKIDNGMTYKGLPVGAPCSGVGACGPGKVVCAPAKPIAVCSVNPDGTESKAVDETCNGKDDDCDGQTDEQLNPATNDCNKQGVCAKALTPSCTAGKWACTYAGFGWEAVETVCDNLDNDCNGVVDDPFPDRGKACDGPDPDSCKMGKLECAPGGKSLVCGKEAGGATAEICDGLDNDCNGKIDETFPELGQVCDGTDSDSCANGTFTCAPGGKTVQCVNEFPKDVVELCDGQDNDCDGKTDEDFGVGDACDGPDSDKCKFGVIICGKDGKPTCGKESKVNIQELCNGLDDDCDGLTDEGFDKLGLKCGDPNGVDECLTGVWACSKTGAMVCEGDYECAIGTACKAGATNKDPDMCVCGASTPCSEAEGDNCDSGKCTCVSKPACTGGKLCSAGTGCK